MKTRIDERALAYPSDFALQEGLRLWKRICKRFELSQVWSEAPAELVATEFLSILRFVLAPRRVEAAVYSSRELTSPLAATLPLQLIPAAGDKDGVGGACGFQTAEFFREGGNTAAVWLQGLEGLEDEARKVAAAYAKHLSSFQKVNTFQLGVNGDYSLRLLVDGPYRRELVETFIAEAKLPTRIGHRRRRGGAFAGPWQRLNRRLSDHLLHESLDRLENDLAVLVDRDTPDVWLLLHDEESDYLRFHAPRPKLQRLLRYFSSEEKRETGEAPTVGELRRRVEERNEDGANGAFRMHLTPCHSGFHHFLKDSWDDESELTRDHLECVAEKFSGWPADRGIAGNIVATGCADIVKDFAEDYRVAAYSYARPPTRISDESDEFYRVRLAERVFIKISPHLVELPLLWGVDENGRGRCSALLLVLFNGHGKEAKDTDYLARRSLSIRAAIEPWFLVFETHARSMEQNDVVHGHIVHEVNGILHPFRKELTPASSSYIEQRLHKLWLAYSFMRDERGSNVSKLSVEKFISLAEQAARDSIQADGRFEYKIQSASARNFEGVVSVELSLDLVGLLIRGLLEDSVADLGNLHAEDMLSDDEKCIDMKVSVDAQPSQQMGRLLLEISHRVTPGAARFIKEHAALLGDRPIFTNNRRRVHLGLFYLGVLLKGCGGEFMRPVLQASEQHVTWGFGFSLRLLEDRMEKDGMR